MSYFSFVLNFFYFFSFDFLSTPQKESFKLCRIKFLRLYNIQQSLEHIYCLATPMGRFSWLGASANVRSFVQPFGRKQNNKKKFKQQMRDV